MQLFAKIFPSLWFDPISEGIGKLQKIMSHILKFLTFGVNVAKMIRKDLKFLSLEKMFQKWLEKIGDS